MPRLLWGDQTAERAVSGRMDEHAGRFMFVTISQQWTLMNYSPLPNHTDKMHKEKAGWMKLDRTEHHVWFQLKNESGQKKNWLWNHIQMTKLKISSRMTNTEVTVRVTLGSRESGEGLTELLGSTKKKKRTTFWLGYFLTWHIIGLKIIG